jgi:hypothetical protein
VATPTFGARGLYLMLGRFRRLAIRYERRADIHSAFLDLGCALLCFATLQHVGCCQALSVGN